MFKLTMEEAALILPSRSQIVTLNRGQNVKYAPHVFTEHGAVMLANILRSPVAIRASIQDARGLLNAPQRPSQPPQRDDLLFRLLVQDVAHIDAG